LFVVVVVDVVAAGAAGAAGRWLLVSICWTGFQGVTKYNNNVSFAEQRNPDLFT
jgi:hypothetical protein